MSLPDFIDRYVDALDTDLTFSAGTMIVTSVAGIHDYAGTDISGPCDFYLEIAAEGVNHAEVVHVTNVNRGTRTLTITRAQANTSASNHAHGAIVRGSIMTAESWVTQIGTLGGSGDVVGPGSAVNGDIVQFDGTTGKLIKDGLGVVTSIATPGVDTNIPTEKAVRDAITAGGGGGGTVGGEFTYIGEVVVGSPTATITFSSIPSTFKHLVIFYRGRSANSSALDDLYMQVNSDTGTNYDREYIVGIGNGTPSCGKNTGVAGAPVGTMVAATGPSNYAGAGRIDIIGYADTNFYKTAICVGGFEDSSNPYLAPVYWVWKNAGTAINRVDFKLISGGNFTANTVFTLYGVGSTSSGDFVKLSQTTLGSDTATITFSSIPSTYSDLEISLMGRTDTNNDNDIWMQVNSDTGSNYDTELMAGVDSTGVATGQAATNQPVIGKLPGSGATANFAGSVQIIIPAYAGTTFFKQANSISGCRGGNRFAITHWWQWKSTSAITDITLLLNGSVKFKTGTVATLYGRK